MISKDNTPPAPKISPTTPEFNEMMFKAGEKANQMDVNEPLLDLSMFMEDDDEK